MSGDTAYVPRALSGTSKQQPTAGLVPRPQSIAQRTLSASSSGAAASTRQPLVPSSSANAAAGPSLASTSRPSSRVGGTARPAASTLPAPSAGGESAAGPDGAEPSSSSPPDGRTSPDEAPEAFERRVQVTLREQEQRRNELRAYLAGLSSRLAAAGDAAAEVPAGGFSSLMGAVIGEHKRAGFSALPAPPPAPSSVGYAAPSEAAAAAPPPIAALAPQDPSLAWLMDPKLRDGVDRIKDLDRRIQSLEDRIESGSRPASRASGRASDAASDAGRSSAPPPSAVLSSATTARQSRLGSREEAFVERILAMSDNDLDGYLSDPYFEALAGLAGPLLRPGSAAGTTVPAPGQSDVSFLTLGEINARLLEYSALHGWAWEAEAGARVESWVEGAEGGGVGGPDAYGGRLGSRQSARPSTGLTAPRPSNMGSLPPSTPGPSLSAMPSRASLMLAAPSPTSDAGAAAPKPVGRGLSRAASGSVRGGGAASELGGDLAGPRPSMAGPGPAAGGAGRGGGSDAAEEDPAAGPSADYLREMRELRELKKRDTDIDRRLLELRTSQFPPGSSLDPDARARLVQDSARELQAVDDLQRRVSCGGGSAFGFGPGGSGLAAEASSAALSAAAGRGGAAGGWSQNPLVLFPVPASVLSRQISASRSGAATPEALSGYPTPVRPSGSGLAPILEASGQLSMSLPRGVSLFADGGSP